MPPNQTTTPVGPENAKRFPPATGRVADLFQAYLAVDVLASRPFADDLHLGSLFAALPMPRTGDRAEPADDDGPAASLRSDPTFSLSTPIQLVR